MPSYLTAGPMPVTCLWVAWRGERCQLRVVARWLAGLLAYLFFVLGPKFLDRDSGMLGKFYLFRPSSLILLLWLRLAAAVATAMLGSRGWILRASLLVLMGPVFLYIQGGQLMQALNESETREHQTRLLMEAVAHMVTPGDVALIDPDKETQLLDFGAALASPRP